MDNKRPNWLTGENVVIVILIIACAAAFWWLVSSINFSYKSGYFHPQRYPREYLNSTTTVPFLVSDIQLWMTFDYLNKVFGLPQNYLKQSMNIQDGRYPNLQLNRYAELNNINAQEFIKSVRSAVQAYKK